MNMNREELAAAEVLIGMALREDIGPGDVTTNLLVPVDMRRKAMMIAKAGGVVAGMEVAAMVFRHLDATLEWNPVVADGDSVRTADVLVWFSANYRALLSGERTALNFLQRMSGVATISNRYATLLEGYDTRILDTRKTLPGWRLLDKYGVRAGGASNHRMGLYDMAMVKNNHITVAGSISGAVAAIRKNLSDSIRIEVETTCLDEVKEALEAGADIIMLDNMDNQTMRKAVLMIGNKAQTEASGNMTPERLKGVAATGVDFISSGALTHSATALDISMRILRD